MSEIRKYVWKCGTWIAPIKLFQLDKSIPKQQEISRCFRWPVPGQGGSSPYKWGNIRWWGEQWRLQFLRGLLSVQKVFLLPSLTPVLEQLPMAALSHSWEQQHAAGTYLVACDSWRHPTRNSWYRLLLMDPADSQRRAICKNSDQRLWSGQTLCTNL